LRAPFEGVAATWIRDPMRRTLMLFVAGRTAADDLLVNAHELGPK
jgi:hypothetical protein